jgi:hypothetical protein
LNAASHARAVSNVPSAAVPAKRRCANASTSGEPVAGGATVVGAHGRPQLQSSAHAMGLAQAPACPALGEGEPPAAPPPPVAVIPPVPADSPAEVESVCVTVPPHATTDASTKYEARMPPMTEGYTGGRIRKATAVH